jgi:hypothetical protein
MLHCVLRPRSSESILQVRGSNFVSSGSPLNEPKSLVHGEFDFRQKVGLAGDVIRSGGRSDLTQKKALAPLSGRTSASVQKLNIGRNTKVRLNYEGFGAHSYYLLRCQRMSASMRRLQLYKRRFPPISTIYWIKNLRSSIPLGDHLSPLYGHPQPNRTHHPTTPSAEGRGHL